MIVKLFKYIEPIWLGKDNQVSIRRVLALLFSYDLIKNTSHVIHKWESGKSFADVAMLLGLEAALIASLLALTTYSANIASQSKPSSDTTNEF